MSIVRCAVIGHGMIGATHGQSLGRRPAAELVGIADNDPGKLPPVIEGGPALHSSFDELIDDVEIDAVWVCTPPDRHRDVVVAALECGIHVYCEKPIAHRVEDAQAMQRAALRSSARLAVGHTLRFHPDINALADAVRSGDIGDIVQANARWATNDAEGVLLSGRVSVAQEMSIHHVDVLRWLLGDVTQVFAQASAIAPTGPGPDAVSAVLQFQSGAIATLDHNWVMPAASGVASDQRITIFGSAGTAYFDAHQPFTRRHAVSGSRHFHTAYRGFGDLVPMGALANADRYFLATLHDETQWPISVQDAIEALRVALAIDESLVTKNPVRIEERHVD